MRKPLIYHEGDGGVPSGGTAPPQGAPAPAPLAQPPASSVATLSQEQFNAALADERRKWKAQQDAAADKARKDAEDKAAQEKGEFEKLANERGQRLSQIEAEHATTAERLTAYEAEMERQITARLRSLPLEIRAMAPEGDSLTRFAWLDKAEAAAQKLAATLTPGTNSGPRGSAARESVNASDDAIARKKASGEYAV